MNDDEHWRIRQEKVSLILDALHDWMLAQRDLVPNGRVATGKGLQLRAFLLRQHQFSLRSAIA